MIILNLWFAGTEDSAKAAYQKLFGLNPVMQQCAPMPYNLINAPNDVVCAKGGRKPIHSVSLKEEDVGKLEEVWEDWVGWSGKEGCGGSVVLTECYGMGFARSVASEETAYPWRECGVQV